MMKTPASQRLTGAKLEREKGFEVCRGTMANVAMALTNRRNALCPSVFPLTLQWN